MLDTSTRLLRLLSTLQIKPDWTGPQLAQRLEVSARTLRRDIARIRELGYPVEATPGVAGGYSLRPGSSLPPLLLTDDEAIAIVISLRMLGSHSGIRESALLALAKLDRLLPQRLQRRAETLRDNTLTLANGAPAVAPQALTLLAEACSACHIVTFEYTSGRQETTLRTVEPYRLVHAGRRWYLAARDRDRQDWRTFRIDRIANPASTGKKFHLNNPPDAAAYVAHSITSAPYPHQAEVTIHASAHQVLEHMPPHVGAIEALDTNSCRLTIGTDSLAKLAMNLAALEYTFIAHQPPELIDELQRLAARLHNAHQASRRR